MSFSGRKYTDEDNAIIRQALSGIITTAEAARLVNCSEDTIRRQWKLQGLVAPERKPPDAEVPENSRWIAIAFNANGKQWVELDEAPYSIGEAMARGSFGLGYTMHRRARGGRELVYTDRRRA